VSYLYIVIKYILNILTVNRVDFFELMSQMLRDVGEETDATRRTRTEDELASAFHFCERIAEEDKAELYKRYGRQREDPEVLVSRAEAAYEA
jgi:hypothetical protein